MINLSKVAKVRTKFRITSLELVPSTWLLCSRRLLEVTVRSRFNQLLKAPAGIWHMLHLFTSRGQSKAHGQPLIHQGSKVISYPSIEMLRGTWPCEKGEGAVLLQEEQGMNSYGQHDDLGERRTALREAIRTALRPGWPEFESMPCSKSWVVSGV